MVRGTSFGCFITKSTRFVLLDPSGDIRKSSFYLEGITLDKIKRGWGDIHKCTYDGKVLKIGEKVE